MALKTKQWYDRQQRDPFVKQARQQGYRSRSAYKLLQLAQQERLFQPGWCVVDLGAAPGGWSQVAVRQVGGQGRVYALDRLAMDPIPGVTFIQGDFTVSSVANELTQQLAGRLVNLIISDMAPNLTGNRYVDAAQSVALAEAAWEWSQSVLAVGGCLLVKLFDSSDAQAWVKTIQPAFQQIKRCKPAASRSESAEFYLLAKGLFANTLC